MASSRGSVSLMAHSQRDAVSTLLFNLSVECLCLHALPIGHEQLFLFLLAGINYYVLEHQYCCAVNMGISLELF